MNNISFLRKLLKDYEQYNVSRYISVSLQAEIESEKENPSIIIWEDLDTRINVSSKMEYNMIKKSFEGKHYGVTLNKLFEVNDKDKILEIMETLISYRNYDDKITSLIYILDDEKKLKLK